MTTGFESTEVTDLEKKLLPDSHINMGDKNILDLSSLASGLKKQIAEKAQGAKTVLKATA